MQETILEIIQTVAPKVITFRRRSPQWNEVRDAFVKKNPKCSCCNSDKKIEVHHIKPFHLFPEEELKSENLISLCDEKCHLLIGHLGSYKSYNLDVRSNCEYLREKILNRP